MMGALSSDGFCDLLRDIAATRPAVGMLAKVTEGKRAGTMGRITWHGVDRFASNRYLDDAQRHLRACMGTWGFRVRIAPEAGEAFFVSAEKIAYCVEAAQ
jgi:hypothetical protein